MRGHVQKRGSRYRGVIYLGRDANRKKKYRYLPTVPTEEQAQLMVADTIGELYRGTYVDQSKMTFGELLDRWVAHKSRRGRRDKTIKWYKSIIEQHLKPALGHIPLQKLTALDLENYYDQALASGQKGKSWGKDVGDELSNSSVAAHYRVIHAALARAVKWRLVAANVADGTEPPQPATGEKRALTVKQAQDFLVAAEKHASHPELYLLAMTTGLRQGELLGLRWQDLEPPLVYVRQALKRPGPNPIFEPPKTKAGERTIWLLPQAVAALERVKVRRQVEKAMAGARYEDHDLVFAQPNGRPLDGHNISRREFKRLLAISGLPEDVRFHDLRHTAATMLKGAGIDDLTVAAILGHTSLSITRRYTTVMMEVLQQAAEKLGSLLFPGNKNP